MSNQTFNTDDDHTNLPLNNDTCDCVGNCFRKLLAGSQPIPQDMIDRVNKLVEGVAVDLDARLEADMED